MDILPLNSTDQSELLDTIDVLRSQGLSSYISLPQLVVCGDQSAGKSSVLEAISGVAFPTKDNLCTRFATELVLRRDIQSNVKITILPDVDRPEEEKEELRRFQVPTMTLEGFPDLVETAKEAMGLNRNAKAFSKDILRMEISGPGQPHLTLVDLPGLIHAESKQQSLQDIELVASLVRNYMANPRSIVLAVVSAKNDYANQIVTKFTREVDPKGLRTLGIITKPDMLHVGSESETAYLGLARNEDVQFRLGWHVLRNRDFDTKHWSKKERDDSERVFFATGVWQTLPLSHLGADSLRPRLSRVLKEQIVAELPELIGDIEAGLTNCRKRFQQLGEPRGTSNEQRLYLIRISETFCSLLNSASNGIYDREFFGDARTDVGFKKRLRAVVQDQLLGFAEAMRIDGHFEEIFDNEEEDESASHGNATSPESSRRRISRSQYMDSVGELLRRTRGRELPGTFNPMVVGDLFFAQSQPWAALVHSCMDQIIAAARTTVELILAYSADPSTTESLLREIINPALERCVDSLRVKVEEVLWAYQKRHPITYNHYFIETIQKARRDHAKKRQSKILHAFVGKKCRAGYDRHAFDGVDVEQLLEALNPETERDMDRFACSEATYCMEAYYKVAMKTLVDNFAVLGIESCLLEGLTDAFAPQVVMRLDDDLVGKIAVEDPESTAERTRTQEKLRILKNGLHTLNRYRRYEHRELRRIEPTDLGILAHPGIEAVDMSTPTDKEGDQAAYEAPQERRGDESEKVVEEPWQISDIPPSMVELLISAKKSGKSVHGKKGVKYRVAAFEDGTQD